VTLSVCLSVSGTKRIFTKISGLVQLSKDLINPAFIWRSLRDVAMATQLKSQKRRFPQKNFLCRLPFRNGLEYRNDNGQLRSILNVATSCINMVRFGAVTPDKRLLIFVLL